MAEYIACRRCDSPDCKGCNLKRLETMLENGKFDCLMNENRAIDIIADVAPVARGEWENGNPICPVCGQNKFKGLDADIWADWQPPFCPYCGAKMDGGKSNGKT